LPPLFSNDKETVTPGISTALLRNRCIRSWRGSSLLSKYLASGHTRTVVPCVRSSIFALRTLSLSTTSPPANAIVATCPSRTTLTSSRLASALVTLTPTPCRPPEKLYAPPAPLSNLPPACRRANTISSTGTCSSGCRPNGMPRPSSVTDTEPSVCTVTAMRLP
jgi:hypothetical protein